MASLNKNNVRLKGNWVVRELPEAASQSFKKGDPLKIASGQVALAAASGSDVTNAVVFAGFALGDATGTTNAKVPVYVRCDASATFITQVDHATPASAVTAKAQVGVAYVMTNQSGELVVAIDTTTNANMTVVDITPDYPEGEQYGTVEVRPLAAYSLLA